MNQQTFFEKFDVLADAPDGVQKLREIIGGVLQIVAFT